MHRMDKIKDNEMSYVWGKNYTVGCHSYMVVFIQNILNICLWGQDMGVSVLSSKSNLFFALITAVLYSMLSHNGLNLNDTQLFVFSIKS